MRCQNCGKKLEDSVKQCPICKTKLGEDPKAGFIIPLDYIDPKTDETEKMFRSMRRTERPIKPKYDPSKNIMPCLYGPAPVRYDVPPIENDDPPKKKGFFSFRKKKNDKK